MTTPTQYKIYQFVTQFMQERGFAPSLNEIAIGIGISPRSLSLVSRYLRVLEQDGLLSMGKTGYRKIQLKSPTGLHLPLVGKIAAGTPIEAVARNETIDFAELFGKEDLYALEVKGDSMIEEGILEGDKVICRRQDSAKENDIVVALIDNENATLKRIHFKPAGKITLTPANASLQPQTYLAHRVQVQGIFIGLLRLM
ncbi:MAG: transcriptional repressor LexA [Pseudomonadota bacterium]